MYLYNIRVKNSLAVTECFTVNSHVFLSEGCRLIAFCPATVDDWAIQWLDCRT